LSHYCSYLICAISKIFNETRRVKNKIDSITTKPDNAERGVLVNSKIVLSKQETRALSKHDKTLTAEKTISNFEERAEGSPMKSALKRKRVEQKVGRQKQAFENS